MLPLTPSLPSTIQCTWRDFEHGQLAEPLARLWLAGVLGCEPAAVAMGRDALGRPRLGASQAGWDVSWSHSGQGLLIVVGKGVDIGADLEHVKPRPRALALALRFLAGSEADWLAALPSQAQEPAFLRLWCAKEAVLKAHGRGIAFGLHKLAFGEIDGVLQLLACDPQLGQPQDWALREFIPHAGYRAAIAWRDQRSQQFAPAY
ncbi:MAG: 4'-phosphopantetheinyl transferase superfamily protein [Luteimonas sp.]